MPNTFYYTSPKTRAQYMLNTSADTFNNAETACNLLGGHLAMFESLSEQQEVEAAFISDGGLIPSFHQNYWFGLEATDWPQFEWMDRTVPMPTRRSYSHWIKNAPFNKMNSCVLSSWNSSYTNAWGWVDADCERRLVYICEVSSEYPKLGCKKCIGATAAAPAPALSYSLRPLLTTRTLWRRAQDGDIQVALQPVDLHPQHHLR